MPEVLWFRAPRSQLLNLLLIMWYMVDIIACAFPEPMLTFKSTTTTQPVPLLGRLPEHELGILDSKVNLFGWIRLFLAWFEIKSVLRVKDR